MISRYRLLDIRKRISSSEMGLLVSWMSREDRIHHCFPILNDLLSRMGMAYGCKLASGDWREAKLQADARAAVLRYCRDFIVHPFSFLLIVVSCTFINLFHRGLIFVFLV